MGHQQQTPQTQACKWITPQQGGGTPEHSLHPVPSHASLPRGLLIFEAFNLCLIIADGVDLRTKHYSCEREEEDGFKTEEDQQ